MLKEIQNPLAELRVPNDTGTAIGTEILQTPVTSEALTALHSRIDQDTQLLDASHRHRLQKLANAAHKCFAERALLLDENRLLFEQNNESNCRKSIRSTKVGEAKLMSYDDIVEAQAKCDAKDAAVLEGKRGEKRGAKRKSCASAKTPAKRARKSEVEVAEDEIEMMGLGDYCSVLSFRHCVN